MRRAERRFVTTGAAACAALVACGAPKPAATTAAPLQAPAAPTPVIEGITFAPGLAIDLPKFTKTKSGAYYRDILPGTGATAGTERTVTVRYVAYLPNGLAVETQATPTTFVIGPDLVRGLREGIPGMRVGGMRTLILPAALAYGREQYGAVPPNSTLVFEIELLRVR